MRISDWSSDVCSSDLTDAVVREAARIILETPGVAHVVPFAGFDGATFTNASNAGAIFSPMQPFEERVKSGRSAGEILADLQQRLSTTPGALPNNPPQPPASGMAQPLGSQHNVQDPPTL